MPMSFQLMSLSFSGSLAYVCLGDNISESPWRTVPASSVSSKKDWSSGIASEPLMSIGCVISCWFRIFLSSVFI